MAKHHASAGEVVDLKTWAKDLEVEKSKAIVKTHGLEIARLVIEAGVHMQHTDYCSVKGAVVIHCIEGEISVKTAAVTKSVKKGQLVFFDGGTGHALTGVEKSVVLLTIVLPQS